MTTFYLINTKTEKVISEGSKGAMKKEKKGLKKKEQKDLKISKIHPTKGKAEKTRTWTPEQVETSQKQIDILGKFKSVNKKLDLILELLQEEEETEEVEEENEDEEEEEEEEEEEDEK